MYVVFGQLNNCLSFCYYVMQKTYDSKTTNYGILCHVDDYVDVLLKHIITDGNFKLVLVNSSSTLQLRTQFDHRSTFKYNVRRAFHLNNDLPFVLCQTEIIVSTQIVSICLSSYLMPYNCNSERCIFQFYLNKFLSTAIFILLIRGPFTVSCKLYKLPGLLALTLFFLLQIWILCQSLN